MIGVNNQNIIDCQSDLEKVKKFVLANPLESVCQYLICYSVVRACGTIEVVAKEIIFNYLSNGAARETINYLEKQIVESSWNPSCGKIQNILDTINPSWSQRFQALTNGTKEKSDLKSLVNLRNDFAHGQAITATIENIEDYFNGSCIILDKLTKVIEGK